MEETTLDFSPQSIPSDDSVKFANELMLADHNLAEMQLKLWILTLSSLSASQTLDPTCKFLYSMRELAQRLGMSTDQAWKTQISRLCDSMIGPTVRIMKRYSHDEDQRHWVKMPIYKLIEYDGRKDSVTIMINEQLYPFLRDLKSKFTEVEVNEILAIKGVNPLRVYLLVREMISEGQNSISIELFKKRLGIQNSYADFKDLQKNVIKAAERQIRKHTSMKDFRFYHDGKGRRAATTIFFAVSDAQEDVHEKEAMKEPVTFLDRLSLLTPEQRKYYEFFCDVGIRPEEKAYELVMSYDIDIVRSNYAYFCERRAKRREGEPPITPGYLVTCLKKDYAKKDRESLARKARASERSQSLVDAYKMQGKMEDADREFRNRAGALIHNAPPKMLLDLIDRYLADIYAVAEHIGFNFSKEKVEHMILAEGNRKLTTREMNAVREVFAQQIKFGRISLSQYTEYEIEDVNEFARRYKEEHGRLPGRLKKK